MDGFKNLFLELLNRGVYIGPSGYEVGFISQEPQLDMTKTVRENVEEAFSDIKNLLNEFNEISAKMGEPLSDEEMCVLVLVCCRPLSFFPQPGGRPSRSLQLVLRIAEGIFWRHKSMCIWLPPMGPLLWDCGAGPPQSRPTAWHG